MKNSVYLLADVETGGFEPAKNPVTELCFHVYDNSCKYIDSYSSRIRVYNNLVIDKKVSEITGLTSSILESTGKPFKAVVDESTAFIKKHTPSHYDRPIFVAHNVLFDYNFIADLFYRAGSDFKGLVKESVICTMALSKLFDNTKETFNLNAVCKAFGVEALDSHNAEGDVKAMGAVFVNMIQSIRNKSIVASEKGTANKDLFFKFNF